MKVCYCLQVPSVYAEKIARLRRRKIGFAVQMPVVLLLAYRLAGLRPPCLELGTRHPSRKSVNSYTFTNVTILYQAQEPRLWQDDYARKPSEGKTAKLEQLSVWRWISLPKNRLSRQPAPASSVGRLILLTVRELAVAPLGCQSVGKQLGVVWHF